MSIRALCAALLIALSLGPSTPPGRRGGDCDEFGCGSNGPSLDGAVTPPAGEIAAASVHGIVLPGGEILSLRAER
jgi:hypothetical protein